MLPKQPNFEGNPPGRIGIPAVGVELHDEVVAALAYGFQATKKKNDSAVVDQTVYRDVRLEQELPEARRPAGLHRRQRRASGVRRRVLSCS